MNSEHCYFHISPNIVVFQQFTPGMYLSVMVTIRNVTPVIRFERFLQTRSTFLVNKIVKLHKKKKKKGIEIREKHLRD